MTGPSHADQRLYPPRPILAASLAVFRDERVLLASRGAPPFDKIWTLPGGLVEAGESLAEAAARELLEETGVVAEVIGFTGYSEFVDRDEEGRVRRHFVICSFAGRWISGEGVPGEELPAMRWLSLADATLLPLTPNLLPILERGFQLSRAS
jgi:ADP-ribose pyrophosphatase YjhB (NUDIX family)